MQKKKPNDAFWLVLGVLNALAVSYPLSVCLEAKDGLERLPAVFALVGAGLLLAIVDTVSIVVAYSD